MALALVPSVAAPAADTEATLAALVDEYVTFVRQDRAAFEAASIEERKVLSAARFQTSARGDLPIEEGYVRRIAAISATTPRGLQEKARALNWFHGGDDARSAFKLRGVDALIGSLVSDLGGAVA